MSLTYRGRKYDPQSFAEKAKVEAIARKGKELNYHGLHYKAG